MMYDFSGDEAPRDFDLIPAKTVVPISIAIQAGDEGTPENAFKVAESGLMQLVLECTVTEGDYENRKVWHRLSLMMQEGVEPSEGQAKAIAISRSFIRSLLEAGRGFAPTDESAEAIEARKMESVFDLEALDVWAELGIDRAKKDSGYSDKNKINKIMPVAAAEEPPGKSTASAAGAPKAGATSPGRGTSTKAPPPAGKKTPTGKGKPAWAK